MNELIWAALLNIVLKQQNVYLLMSMYVYWLVYAETFKDAYYGIKDP